MTITNKKKKTVRPAGRIRRLSLLLIATGVTVSLAVFHANASTKEGADEEADDAAWTESADAAYIRNREALSAVQESTVQEAAPLSSGESPFSADDWRLILVNKQHPIPEDYQFELGAINHELFCDARIIPDLRALLSAANGAGHRIYVASPYRDDATQEQIFEAGVQEYMREGMTYTEAYIATSRTITIPGTSEHQIGLALDLLADVYQTMDEGFGATKAGEWLAAHSAEYGFILRYPEGKSEITGISYEPWHFRYVGKEAAKVILEEKLTLEEFREKYVR